MSSFRDIHFTPNEFAQLIGIERTQISALESKGLLKTFKKKVGHVERKMIALEDAQDYLRRLRAQIQEDAYLAQVSGAGNMTSAAAATAVTGANASSEISVDGTVANSMGDGATAAGPALPIEVGVETAARLAGMTIIEPQNKTQMFYNVKGGTGKSTLSAQYAMRAAMLGLNVLAIDLDGQGHLTVNLDVLDAHERPTVYDVLINDLPMQDAIMNVAPCLDLVPANLGLCNIEIPLNQKARREYRLNEAIKKVSDQYDIIIADTNPAASILNSSMLVASNLVVVVCATNPLSFHGMSLVMSTIEVMEREFQHKLNVKIIPNLYDNREVISQEVLG